MQNPIIDHYLIWPEYPALDSFFHPPEHPIGMGFNRCARAGGGYIMTNAATGMLNNSGRHLSEKEQKLRARLTTMLVNQRQHGNELPLVTPKLIEEARSSPPLPVHERADRLLRYLVSKSNNIGKKIEIGCEGERNCYGEWKESSDSPTEQNAMAWTESISEQEVRFLTVYLQEQGWIEAEFSGRCERCWVLVDGYKHVADQITNPSIAQAFVAMWLNDDVTEAYEKGIKPAIEQSGYEPLRIDKKSDVDKIDDEIIAEIRRSRFLIADFTHGEKGARGSVYYEAGFAHGLGIPVICTCRSDMVDMLHFDTRQYHHTVWETHDDLCEALRNRILAVIGEGPNVHSPGA